MLICEIFSPGHGSSSAKTLQCFASLKKWTRMSTNKTLQKFAPVKIIYEKYFSWDF